MSNKCEMYNCEYSDTVNDASAESENRSVNTFYNLQRELDNAVRYF